MNSTPKLAPVLVALLLAGNVAPIAAAQTPARAAANGQTVVLFDGKGLNGWKPVETPQMELLRDGTLANQRGKGLLYYAERAFSDFTLELEYLPESGGAAAGVFRRLPQAPATLDAAERSACEVKLGEDPKMPVWR